jgi:hypothetical protein
MRGSTNSSNAVRLNDGKKIISLFMKSLTFCKKYCIIELISNGLTLVWRLCWSVLQRRHAGGEWCDSYLSPARVDFNPITFRSSAKQLMPGHHPTAGAHL